MADFLVFKSFLALVLVDLVLAFTDLVAALDDLAFVLAVFDLLDLVELIFLPLPGNARQCALVFLPFLSVDALRHVHVDCLDEHALFDRPLHWLAALADKLAAKPKLTAIASSVFFPNLLFFKKLMRIPPFDQVKYWLLKTIIQGNAMLWAGGRDSLLFFTLP